MLSCITAVAVAPRRWESNNNGEFVVVTISVQFSCDLILRCACVYVELYHSVYVELYHSGGGRDNNNEEFVVVTTAVAAHSTTTTTSASHNSQQASWSW